MEFRSPFMSLNPPSFSLKLSLSENVDTQKNSKVSKIPFSGLYLTKVNLWPKFCQLWVKPYENPQPTITSLLQPFGSSFRRFQGRMKAFEAQYNTIAAEFEMRVSDMRKIQS